MQVHGKILFGSNNYHLNTSTSDKDYKLIVIPEFYELYNNVNLNKSNLPIGYDKEHDFIMDFRGFDSLLRKGNFNAIELLFSTEIFIYEQRLLDYLNIARKVYQNGYCAVIWPVLYKSSKGLVANSLKRDGYNPKTVSRSIYIVNFLSNLVLNNFVLTTETWEDPKIWSFPQSIRTGSIPLPTYTEQDWKEMFDYIDIIASNTLNKMEPRAAQFQQYNNELAYYARQYVASSIKKELIKNYD